MQQQQAKCNSLSGGDVGNPDATAPECLLGVPASVYMPLSRMMAEADGLLATLKDPEDKSRVERLLNEWYHTMSIHLSMNASLHRDMCKVMEDNLRICKELEALRGGGSIKKSC